jgi:hypothetical protein
MTAAIRTECSNARSDHFPTEELAAAEVLDRKIRDACWGKRGNPIERHVEHCEPCDLWMIVKPQQRSRRSGRG